MLTVWISNKISILFFLNGPLYNKSSLAQVMMDCSLLDTSNYLNHYWLSHLTPYGVTRPKYKHYNDVIMSLMVSQITSLTTVYLTVYLGTDQRKHQSSASLAFVRGIHRWQVNSPHKGPVTRKMFPFDDAIRSHWCPLWWGRLSQNEWHERCCVYEIQERSITSKTHITITLF